MKQVIISDVHGRSIWKDIITLENPDKVIFLGDYVTSREHISPEQQLSNLEEILQYKEDKKEDVILLRGNHCLCELGYYWAKCYPNEPKVKQVMSVDPLKSRFLDLTQWVYIDKELKTIFSHAGVSSIWMENSGISSVYDINNLEPSELFEFTPSSPWDMNGDSETQPPVWIRPQALCECNVKGWDQVVGHTPVKAITNIGKFAKGKQNIWLCDALEVKQYLVIDNNEFQPKTFEQ